MKTNLKSSKRIIPIVSTEMANSYSSLYSSQHKVYPRNTKGYFKSWRWLMIWITQIIFYVTPWMLWDNRQSVLFDISAHKFYIFELVIFPQDLIYLAFILIISALALFLFTAVAGRVWCGFACPQSVYTEIFLWIERKVEGDRVARIKLDQNRLNSNKLLKKSIKHILWIGFSIWTGFTFLGYFSPIRELMQNVLNFSLSNWETFWIVFYGLATYGNAGYLREQVCKYMCPYARFQSSMFDKNTLIVAYDVVRGEPRSGRSRKIDFNSPSGLGDCIDCTLCVQVCPVGIDIRNGLQYECISCGLCIDACNNVMDMMQYPRDLIRFSTQNGVSQQWSKSQIIKNIFRPRVLFYVFLLLIATGSLVFSVLNREPFKVDVIRDRGVMARVTDQGSLENIYQLLITNVSGKDDTYHVQVSGIEDVSVVSNDIFKVNAASENKVVLSVRVPSENVNAGVYPIKFKVVANNSKRRIFERSVFYVPAE
jgi:cytochrome c oxidase accessory protein FixG